MGQRHALDESRNDYWGHSVDTLKTIYGPGFRTITPQGYLLEDCGPNDAQPEYAHYFCGPHDVPGATCPNCDKPLLRLLAIDTRDPRLELTYCPFDTLSLFYCMTCEICMDAFCYQARPPDGRIEILYYKSGKLEPGNIAFTPEPYPLYFPGVAVRLVPLSEQQQWFILEYERLVREYVSARDAGESAREEALHRAKQELFEEHFALLPHKVSTHEQFEAITWEVRQIGGFPMLGQGWGEGWQCPVCDQEMVFLAALDDVNTDPRGFVGTGVAQFQFTWCPTCLVVGAVCVER